MLLAQGLVSPVRTSPVWGIVILVLPLSFSDCLTSQPLTLLFMPPAPGTVQFLCSEWINQVIRMDTRVTLRRKKGKDRCSLGWGVGGKQAWQLLQLGFEVYSPGSPFLPPICASVHSLSDSALTSVMRLPWPRSAMASSSRGQQKL